MEEKKVAHAVLTYNKACVIFLSAVQKSCASKELNCGHPWFFSCPIMNKDFYKMLILMRHKCEACKCMKDSIFIICHLQKLHFYTLRELHTRELVEKAYLYCLCFVLFKWAARIKKQIDKMHILASLKFFFFFFLIFHTEVHKSCASKELNCGHPWFFSCPIMNKDFYKMLILMRHKCEACKCMKDSMSAFASLTEVTFLHSSGITHEKEKKKKVAHDWNISWPCSTHLQ